MAVGSIAVSRFHHSPPLVVWAWAEVAPPVVPALPPAEAEGGLAAVGRERRVVAAVEGVPW